MPIRFGGGERGRLEGLPASALAERGTFSCLIKPPLFSSDELEKAPLMPDCECFIPASQSMAGGVEKEVAVNVPTCSYSLVAGWLDECVTFRTLWH